AGAPSKGLSTGHVSLEPALLLTLKLMPEAYLQAETACWIPVSGEPLYAGDLFHAHLSFNQVLLHILPDVQLIGTAEASLYSFGGGNYTSPDLLAADPSSGMLRPIPVSATATMLSVGPGIRLNICDKIDFGVGSNFS